MNRRETILGLTALAAAPRRLHAPLARLRTIVRFWAIGREGEVAADLVQDFLREQPDIHVEVQKLPWTAAHEKLLTAYAGETLPDLCQLGNTWIPEFTALDALEPLDDMRAHARARSRSTITSRASWTPIASTGRLYGIPWYVDTRVLFYRRDLLQQAGFDAPPTTWAEWEQHARRDQGSWSARIATRSCCRSTSSSRCSCSPCSSPRTLLRDGGRYGNFRSADFRRTLAFYASMFRARLGAAHDQHADLERLGRVRRAASSRSTSPGRGTSPSSGSACRPQLQDAWMTAPMPGPDGPGVSSAGGASLVIFSDVADARRRPGR